MRTEETMATGVTTELEAKKLGKIFRMLKWISIAPGLNAETLGGLIGVSKRGVHRYIKDLRALGIPIKVKKGIGYSLEDSDILSALRWNGAERESTTPDRKGKTNAQENDSQ